MTEPIDLLSAILVGAGLMMGLLGLSIAVFMPGADRWNKRFFIFFFLCVVLYAGFCTADGWISPPSDAAPVLKAAYYFQTLLGTILILMTTLFLLHWCGEKWRNSFLFRVVGIFWIILFVVNFIAPFTDQIYYLSPQGEFFRGPLYPLVMVMFVPIPVLNLIFAFRWRSRMSKRYFYAFIFSMIPMIITLLIHIFVSVFALLGFSIAICALAMFGIVLFDQVDRMMRQQREIAHQRASIMVLQMRPHFIYNTMMSIYYLCKQDPDRAQRVTLDFTTYLRKNFTAIASEDLIPFSEELEHTRAYLAVEQAQHEDFLTVEYDTPHVGFRLPPLTLQPIVENAVKHGLDPDSEPLRIMIRTARTAAGSEITVEDTGAGFGTVDDGAPHIALKNIQQRLEIMCHGTMTIHSRQGGGTVVRVTIPDAK